MQTGPLAGPDGELLVGLPDDPPEGLFDRFYVNLHGRSEDVLVLLGGGVYPGSGIVDAWLIAVVDGVQRNARFSTVLERPLRDVPGVGPFRWSAPDPAQRWRFDVDRNLTGVEVHADFVGRFPVFSYERLEFTSSGGVQTSFDHAVQSGRWAGEVVVDGRSVDVTGDWGQRDRSRGVRGMHAGAGFHLWMQPQFEDWHVTLMYDESREGEPTLCEGAVITADMTDAIVAVDHALSIDPDNELTALRLTLHTESGAEVVLDGRCPGPGGPYLQGGGYDGRHGRWVGLDHQSGERWVLADEPTPRTLATPYAHRLTRFESGSETGWGITEFSQTRKPTYRYRPTKD
ncbi:MAG TPA: hypothetical protein VFE15_06660 [Marmoricola sp.]|nr:hypothetical protein [Marmoricola sp.]